MKKKILLCVLLLVFVILPSIFYVSRFDSKAETENDTYVDTSIVKEPIFDENEVWLLGGVEINFR